MPDTCGVLFDLDGTLADTAPDMAYALVALFGYPGIDDEPADWGADGMIGHPLETLGWLDG
jgi:phosphoglycolate phosphatase-like HAD superfamily hydrolase